MFPEGQCINIFSASVLTKKLCCDIFQTTNISGKRKRTCDSIVKDQNRDFFLNQMLTHQLTWGISPKLLERIDWRYL